MIRWATSSRLALAAGVLAVVAWAPPGAAGQVHRDLVTAVGWLIALGRDLAGEVWAS